MAGPYAPSATTAARRTRRWPWVASGLAVLIGGAVVAEHLWVGPDATRRMCDQARTLTAYVQAAPSDPSSPSWPQWFAANNGAVVALSRAAGIDSSGANQTVEDAAKRTVNQWALEVRQLQGGTDPDPVFYVSDLRDLDAACHVPTG